MKNEIPVTEKLKLTRATHRASYDRDVIYSIIDEQLVCQIGIVRNGHAVILPMAYGRQGDKIYLHGSSESPFIKEIIHSEIICINIVILDGIVFARSSYAHGMNFRSVTIYGKPEELAAPDDKIKGLKIIMDRLLKNRWENARKPSEKELSHTSVFSVSLEEASAKIRSGPPKDFKSDLDRDIWAGVLPLKLTASSPVADEQCRTEPDEFILNYRREDYNG
ncbi:MAG: pyridoxamine 5'-phosphate oxidase family protein [Spirochaetia bacterium]|nr:pyridoxamine 5'-phosphate oxidase family protein [Spirochaetia bacterium]